MPRATSKRGNAKQSAKSNASSDKSESAIPALVMGRPVKNVEKLDLLTSGRTRSSAYQPLIDATYKLAEQVKEDGKPQAFSVDVPSDVTQERWRLRLVNVFQRKTGEHESHSAYIRDGYGVQVRIRRDRSGDKVWVECRPAPKE